MTESQRLELTMIEAIHLYRNRPPAEWTPDELAAFRLRLEQSPSLGPMLGRPQEIERRLEEVATALAAAEVTQAAAEAAAPKDAAGAVKPKRWSRRLVVEVVMVVALLSAGIIWVGSMMWQGDGTAAAIDPHAKTKEVAKGAKPQADKPPADTAPADEPPRTDDEHTWQGWAIATAPSVHWVRNREWDISDPGNPRPANAIMVEGGPLTLSQRRTIGPADHWLELDARPVEAVEQAGTITVRIDGADAAQAPIGTGETKYPLYVSLAEHIKKKVLLEVVFKPGEPGQKIGMWHLDVVPDQSHTPRAASLAAEGLTSADPAMRSASAALALQTQDQLALHSLIVALDDKVPTVRLAAADALSKYTAPRARPPLRKILVGHKDMTLRLQVAALLVTGAVPADVEAFNKALDSPDSQLRAAAVQGLNANPDPSAVPPLVRALSDKLASIRLAAASSLAQKNTEPAHAAMLTALTSHPDNAVRFQAAQHFGQFPNPNASDALAAALKSDSDALRLRALQSLGAINDPKSSQVLVTLLNDPDSSIRQTAAAYLAQRNHIVAREALLAALASHPDNAVRLQAAVYCRSVPAPLLIDHLTAALKIRHEATRMTVVQALGAIHNQRATQALATALTDEDASIRQTAAIYVAQRNEQAAHAAMFEALKSNPDEAVRLQAATHFVQMPQPAALPALLAVLNDPSHAVRVAAVQAVGRIGGEQVVDGLRTALADTNPTVKEAAIQALRQNNQPRAKVVLKEAGIQ